MEDYTYHLQPKNMKCWARTCWRFAPASRAAKPSLEMHPLGIGGKADPVRLVFDAPPGPALNASLMDLGNRFRLLINEVDVVAPGQAAAQIARGPRRLAMQTRSADAPPRPGFTPAAPIIPASARRSPPRCWRTLPTSPGSKLVIIDDTTRLREFKQGIAPQRSLLCSGRRVWFPDHPLNHERPIHHWIGLRHEFRSRADCGRGQRREVAAAVGITRMATRA